MRIEGPKDRLTPDLVAALKESKPAILAWLRDLETAETVPLNDMQLAYLLGRDGALDLGGVSSHVFHEFTGAWDLPQLEAALQRVIDRHDALRMRIDGDVARIMPAGRVRAQIPVKEVSGPETETVLQAHRDEMNAQVMPVSRVPLVDLRAVRTPEATHLFVSHDGLIIDGLSMASDPVPGNQILVA